MNRDDLLKAMNGIDDDDIRDAMQNEESSKKCRALRKTLIAAAIAACLAITAFAIAPKFVRLVNTWEEVEADMEQQLEQYGDAHGADMSVIENEVWSGEKAAEVEKDTIAKWIDRIDRDRRYEILSDETDTSTGTRKLIYSTLGHPGALYTAEDITTLLKHDARFDADFSYLEQIGTPVSGTLLLEQYFRPYSSENEPWSKAASLHGTYRTPSGGAITLGVGAYEDTVQRTTAVYSTSFAFEDTVTSADGVEYTIFGLPSGRIFAETFKGHVGMSFIAFACPREEVEDIISHCYVAQMIDNLSTIGEK